MRSRRTLLAAVLLAPALASCTAGGDEGPPADDAAAALAEALTAGKVADVAVTTDSAPPQRLWRKATEGMGEATAAVEVASVEEATPAEGDAGTADVSLRLTWTLPDTDATWTTDGTTTMTRAKDGSWLVAFDEQALGLEPGERLDLDSVDPERAGITGAGGVLIVKDRPVLRIGVDKARVTPGKQAAAARAVAQGVDVDAAAFVERVEASGENAFVEAIVLRENEAAATLRAVGGIDGAGVLSDTLPLAPTREFARPILGTVGPVTAEMVKESDGALKAGDEAGISGLQERYDERLRGTPGWVVTAESKADDAEPRELFRLAPEAGKPLETTLDPARQALAERLLAGVGPASALVALQPSTGDVVAAASGPGGGGLSTATVGQYAPGSTFKVVSSLALLRDGLTPASRVSCPATTVVDGKTFKNYDDYPAGGQGSITLRQAVANSCNTAFIGQRDRADDLAGAAEALGLGTDFDLGFPAYFGQVPPTRSETSAAAALIGQGEVLASPLTMAAVAASVADGRTVVPHLLAEFAPEADPATALTRGEAGTLRGLMRAVVTEGSGSALADVPGAPVLAKTGTAEFGDAEPLQTHAWMIGVQGDLAVAVFVAVGDSGSGTAGPLLEQFLRGAS